MQGGGLSGMTSGISLQTARQSTASENGGTASALVAAGAGLAITVVLTIVASDGPLWQQAICISETLIGTQAVADDHAMAASTKNATRKRRVRMP